MSLRTQVEYATYNPVENTALLQELRLGEPSEAEVSNDEMFVFLTQLLLGAIDGLLLVAKHIDEQASGGSHT